VPAAFDGVPWARVPAALAAQRLGEAERLLGHGCAAGGVVHAGVHLKRRKATHVLVRHDPVQQLAVEVGHSVGAQIERGEGHERCRRSLQRLAANDRADGHDGSVGL